MKKITYIVIAIAITFLINPSKIHAQSEQPDYKLIYDTLLTTLEPSIQKEIINYYGYPKQYGLYDAKILSIIREPEGQFSFTVKVQVTTFEHAHDPPYGKETMTFKIDPFGVKTISFKHEGGKEEKDINGFYKETLSDIDNVLRNYVQGQVMISAILAASIYVGYLLIKLDYSLLLAIFAFFMNMIPFIGPWISLAPAVVVALVQDPILVIWVCVITLVAQQVESNLITPNIMGEKLNVHPLTVISIVLAAGNIAGFIAIIIAIPTYAVIKAIVINIYEERKKIKEAATKSV